MPRPYRNRIFPRQISDIGAFIFVTIMMPLTFAYEVKIVLPELYEDSAIFYYFHISMGSILLFNILGNFWQLWLTDTSTRHVILPSVIKQKWDFCASCEAVQPPRAWHCSVCGVCVLKREHHCMFVGYCIGHRNHRYFCMFLFYMWLGVCYCTFFNTKFLQTQMTFTWDILPKFIFPLISLITFDMSWLQVYIFFWSAHFAAMLLCTVLLLYHSNLVLQGRTTHENNTRKNAYNLGWKQNMTEVFGEKWKRAMMFPFAASKLPHDGVNWDTRDSWHLNGPKSR